MLVKRRDLLSVGVSIIWMLVFVFTYIQIPSTISTFEYNFVSGLTVLSLATILICNSKTDLKITSPYNIILILTYIYTCGQMWLVSLGVSLKKTSYLITYYDDQKVLEAVLITMLFICAINIFAVLISSSKYIAWKTTVTRSRNEIMENAWEYTGIAIGVVFAVTLMIYDIQQIIMARSTNSYAASYMVGRSNPVYYMASYAYPLPVFMILCTTKRPLLKKVVTLYAVGRPILMMLMVGSRSFYLPMLVAMFVYYLNTSKRQVKWGKILFIGFIGILLYSFVAATRNTSGVSITQYMIDNNFFVDFLQEMGGTIVCTILLTINCPKLLPYAWGKSYVGSILTLIPGLGSIAARYEDYINIAKILNKFFAKGSGLGGFYLSEFYYNFSMLGLVFMPIVAYAFVRISASCESIKSSNSPIRASIAYYIFSLSMIYIRAEAYELFYGIKVIIIVMIVFYVLYHLIRRKSNVKTNN